MQLKAIALAFIWFLSIHFLVAQTIEKNKSTFGTKTQQNKKVIVLDRVIDTVVVKLNESDILDQRNVEKVVTIELESEDESPSNAIKKYKIITRDEEDNVDEYEWTESVEGRIINEDKSNNTPRWIQKGDKGMKKNDRPRKLKRKIDGQAPRRDFNIEEEI